MLQRLAHRIRYFWDGMDPDGVELLSAALSLTFAVLLIYRGQGANMLAGVYWYAALCFASGILKVAGVLLEILAVRIAGLLLGTIFWITLSYVLLKTVPGSIAWLCYAVLALAQLWAIRRLVTRGRWRA